MNWDAISAVAEVAGAIAVVVTLVYLAIQVRQSTHTVRAATTTAHIDSVRGFTLLLGQNRELSDLYFDALSADVELNESQKRQFEMLLSGFLLALQQAFILDQEGVVHPEVTAYHEMTLDWIVAQPGFSIFWDTWGQGHTPRFRDYVEVKLQQHIS